MRYVFLPGYSPDYNPIEEMFSTTKAYARRNNLRLRVLMWDKAHSDVARFVHEALMNVTADPHKIRGWFRHYILDPVDYEPDEAV